MIQLWRLDAACLGHDTNLWFPTSNGKAGAKIAARAKAVCRGCPVAQQCLTHALSQPETTGIWGGLTAQERFRLARRRKARTCT